MNSDKINELIKNHSDIYKNLEPLEVIPEDDPDLLKMEEIMEEIEKLEKNEN